MVTQGFLVIYVKFSLVVIVTTWLGDLTRAFCKGGVGEKVITQICNRSLKASVFFIQ